MKNKTIIYGIIGIFIIGGVLAATFNGNTIEDLSRLAAQGKSSDSILHLNQTGAGNTLSIYSNASYYDRTIPEVRNDSALYIYNHDMSDGNYTIKPITVSTQGLGDSHIDFIRYSDTWWSKSNINFKRARGNYSQEQTLQAGDAVGRITWSAWDGEKFAGMSLTSRILREQAVPAIALMFANRDNESINRYTVVDDNQSWFFGGETTSPILTTNYKVPTKGKLHVEQDDNTTGAIFTNTTSHSHGVFADVQNEVCTYALFGRHRNEQGQEISASTLAAPAACAFGTNYFHRTFQWTSPLVQIWERNESQIGHALEVLNYGNGAAIHINVSKDTAPAINISLGNITMHSPDGTGYNCGVANGGTFSCS